MITLAGSMTPRRLEGAYPMLQHQDAAVVQGDDVTLEFTITNLGVPVNLTGAVLRWQLERPTTPLQKNNADMDVSQLANGIVRVPLVSADTASLPPDHYNHGLRVTLASKQEHVSIGRIHVIERIVT
jgi:hypothetical protein